MHFWFSSQFLFLRFITIWVFEFHHSLSFWVHQTLIFFLLNYITIWVSKFQYHLSLWNLITILVFELYLVLVLKDFNHFFCFIYFCIESLQTSLLCRVGELAGEGSVAVPVVRGRWQVTDNMQHLTSDTWREKKSLNLRLFGIGGSICKR